MSGRFSVHFKLLIMKNSDYEKSILITKTCQVGSTIRISYRLLLQNLRQIEQKITWNDKQHTEKQLSLSLGSFPICIFEQPFGEPRGVSSLGRFKVSEYLNARVCTLGDFKVKLWGVASVVQSSLHENMLNSGRGRNLHNGYSSWLEKRLSSWWDHWGQKGSNMAEHARQRAIIIYLSRTRTHFTVFSFL